MGTQVRCGGVQPCSATMTTTTTGDTNGSTSIEESCDGVGLFGPPSIHTPKLGSVPLKSSEGVTLDLAQLNPHFVCVLCFGYFVDATTITECMHTFCRSCIVTFLRTNRHCPHCDTLLLKTRPLSSLRSDRVLQALVYKTVPGLFQTEMRRRIRFYQRHKEAVGSPAYQKDVQEFQQFVFSPDDSVSLAIRHYDSKRQSSDSSDGSTDSTPVNGQLSDSSSTHDEQTADCMVRYFRCPSTVPVSVLKALIKSKYRVPDSLRVELLHGEHRLLDAWTLMEIAYIYTWTRESPLELSFQVVATRRVKKRKHPNNVYVNNNNKPKIKEDFPFSSDLPPPEPPSAPGTDDIKEPSEKVAKMEAASEEEELNEDHTEQGENGRLSSQKSISNSNSKGSGGGGRVVHGHHQSHHHHITAMSLSEDQHERPPTPPETPESHHQHILTKCENIDTENDDEEQAERDDDTQDTDEEESEEVQQTTSGNIPVDLNLITPSDEAPDDEDEGMCGDQDSEAPLEVDTSHETEPELEIDIDSPPSKRRKYSFVGSGSRHERITFSEERQNGHCKEQKERRKNSSRQASKQANNTESDSEEPYVKPPRRIRRNVVVQAGGQDESCAFSDSDDNGALDESGALDLSNHARNVREARAREGYDASRGQGTQTILSVTQSKTPKKKGKLNHLQNSQAGGSNWQQGSAATQAAAFALLQLAFVQAKAQEEAKKSPNKSGQSSDSLSIVHGSGHSLTISAVNGGNNPNQKTDATTKTNNSNCVNSVKSPSHKSGVNNVKNAGSAERAITNTITISRAGKDGTLKSKINKSPTHRSSVPGTLKVPNVTSNQTHKSPDRRSKSIEKDCFERTGDPVFKITNQKLSECFRQQMSNKLKLINGNCNSKNSSSPSSHKVSSTGSVSDTKTSISTTNSNKSCFIKDSAKSQISAKVVQNTSTPTSTSSNSNNISKKSSATSCLNSKLSNGNSNSHVVTQSSSKNNISNDKTKNQNVSKPSMNLASPTLNNSVPNSAPSLTSSKIFLSKSSSKPVCSASNVTNSTACSNSSLVKSVNNCNSSFSNSIANNNKNPTSTKLNSSEKINENIQNNNTINKSANVDNKSVKVSASPSVSSSISPNNSNKNSIQNSSSSASKPTTVSTSCKPLSTSSVNSTKSITMSSVAKSTSNTVPKVSPITSINSSKYYSTASSPITISSIATKSNASMTNTATKSVLSTPKISNPKITPPITITPITKPSSSLIIPRHSLSSSNGLVQNSSSLSQSNKSKTVTLSNSKSSNMNGSTPGNGFSTVKNTSQMSLMKTGVSQYNSVTFTPIKTPVAPSSKLSTSTSASTNTTKSIISPNRSTPATSISISTTVTATSVQNNPLRTLLGASVGVSSISSSMINNSSISNRMTPSLVRPTNSSVRQIPNPSLLHQQSENRLNAGLSSGAKLNGVLSRLTGGSGNGSGLSRIESLTRSLHEKAAGAAAAINTAAR